jgi:hypothetical protein
VVHVPSSFQDMFEGVLARLLSLSASGHQEISKPGFCG